MIGRAAVRNPWLFGQIRDDLAGRPVGIPTGHDVLKYIHQLYEAVCSPGVPEASQVQKMKKYMNFIGEGINPEFVHDVRRTTSQSGLFALCAAHLDHDRPIPGFGADT
jgi:tRNA-dihydrouridine synthase